MFVQEVKEGWDEIAEMRKLADEMEGQIAYWRQQKGDWGSEEWYMAQHQLEQLEREQEELRSTVRYKEESTEWQLTVVEAQIIALLGAWRRTVRRIMTEWMRVCSSSRGTVVVEESKKN